MSATTKTDHALERLVFFSDAVFAIAITLLVIEVRVPELPKGSADSAYWQTLHDLVPSFAGYLISFAMIGAFWVVHHRAFTLSQRYDSKLLPWNMGLLGLIAFMPFTTAFLTHNMAQRVPTLIYCLVLIVAGLVNVAVVRLATGPGVVDPGGAPAAIAHVRARSYGLVLCAFTALAVGLVEPRYFFLGLASIGLWRRIFDRFTG